MHIPDQPTTIHHWQLKDLLACENPKTLYTVCDRSTVRYDTMTKKVAGALQVVVC